MEYIPRYRQPFTWEQLLAMEVPQITQEIARLQHSLELLNKTQKELKQHLEQSPDPDLEDAVKENEDTIGSQSERILMMRLALEAKGFSKASNPHYDVSTEPQPQQPAHRIDPPFALPAHSEEENEDGVYL
ncbi:hypothetical protein EXIGLDRAFT_599861 [Exidia glandulosa HHB12029]|uniref:Uncharacterized protein n=1 Tax=Exidia glandulosa HHB12029 TaxID=1314781 RepID=A0A165QLD3_EXIGL|nr:hypothetical protein EXIGLDRAFT_599861 [Exidia glandulosa HHB12029]